ncbi:MAG: hypothetical protein Q9219_007126 [cf. Caloplaca sp. 3 TL-2023]
MNTQPSPAQECANLHNSLIERLPGQEPHRRRDYINILQTQHPALYSSLQGTELLGFLSLIDNYEAPGNDTRLTPLVRKPTPACFLNLRESDPDNRYPGLIPLHPDAESSNEGGIAYDLATNLATWAFFPPWPRPEDWVPLCDILRTWLHLGNTDKFHFDEEIQDLAIRSWVPHDLEDALESWNVLIQTIATRLPMTDAGNNYYITIV